MGDPKSGFRMEYSGGQYKVMYNHTQHGIIKPSEFFENEWVFTDYLEGKVSTAPSLSECKKVAKVHLKAILKKNNFI